MKHRDIFLPAEVDQGRPPIKVKFEIPYFTVSGIQVTYNKLLHLVSFWTYCIEHFSFEFRKTKTRTFKGLFTRKEGHPRKRATLALTLFFSFVVFTSQPGLPGEAGYTIYLLGLHW